MLGGFEAALAVLEELVAKPEMIQLSSEVVVSPVLPDGCGPQGMHNGGCVCPASPDGRGMLGVCDVSFKPP
jgi:hypothetical protein